MQKVLFIGNARNGKLEILDKDKFRNDFAEAFKEDVVVEGVIEKQSRSRTNQQNRWLWGVAYKILSDHTGYTPEEIHEIIKYKFLRKHYTVGDEQYDVGSTTTTLSTVEFSEYKEKIQRFGATLGCNIPDPNESDSIFNTLNQELDLQKQETKE